MARIRVTPEISNHQERLSYTLFSETPSNGQLTIAWEKIRVIIPFQVK
ncbi:MAG: hypothetical protein JNM78_11075 [Cyclobacteriaceae bacterium]|nr:hypothetical protein [Cyclobacteriaceae bacterium]